jgi:hypothetical protein
VQHLIKYDCQVKKIIARIIPLLSFVFLYFSCSKESGNDMPSRFLQEEKKISFSLWTDIGSYYFSSTLAPHILEVKDVSEE